MRGIIFLLVLSATSISCFGQIQSSCTPSAALQKLYANDASDMALQRIFNLHTPDTAVIEIPETNRDTMLGFIAVVCNLGVQYEADSVFRNYCIHRWPRAPYRPATIIVKVDTSYNWAKQWSLGNKITGYKVLDDFLSLHGVAQTYYLYDDEAFLTAGRSINTLAFVDSLRLFPGVVSIRWAYGTPPTQMISYTMDSLVHFQFFSGWGDCPSGCTSWKIWKYTVDPATCIVRLDTAHFGGGKEHYSLPNCNLWPASVSTAHPSSGISVFPNPVSSTLQIAGNANGIVGYRIFDATGRCIIEDNSKNSQVDVSGLAQGFYTILIQTRSGSVVVRKFVRQ